MNRRSGWIDELKREKFSVCRRKSLDTTSINRCDVAAKGFQVITQLHSSPVIGRLRGSRSSVSSCRSDSMEDSVRDFASDECFLEFNQMLDCECRSYHLADREREQLVTI